MASPPVVCYMNPVILTELSLSRYARWRHRPLYFPSSTPAQTTSEATYRVREVAMTALHAKFKDLSMAMDLSTTPTLVSAEMMLGSEQLHQVARIGITILPKGLSNKHQMQLELLEMPPMQEQAAKELEGQVCPLFYSLRGLSLYDGTESIYMASNR